MDQRARLNQISHAMVVKNQKTPLKVEDGGQWKAIALTDFGVDKLAEQWPSTSNMVVSMLFEQWTHSIVSSLFYFDSYSYILKYAASDQYHHRSLHKSGHYTVLKPWKTIFQVLPWRHLPPLLMLCHGPLVRYVKLWVVHAPGMAVTFSLPSQLASLVVSFEISGRERVPSIPGACTTRNFTYLLRGLWWLLGGILLCMAVLGVNCTLLRWKVPITQTILILRHARTHTFQNTNYILYCDIRWAMLFQPQMFFKGCWEWDKAK